MITFKQYLIERTKPDVQDVQLGFITKSGVRKVKEKKKVEEQFLQHYMHKAFDDEESDPDESWAHKKKLQYHFEESGHDIDHEHGEHVHDYTSYEHHHLNKNLHDGIELQGGQKRMDEGISNFLRTAKMPSDTITYTGVKNDLRALAYGKTEPFHITYRGYTSTSLKKSTASGFSEPHPPEAHEEDDVDHVRHVLKVHIPKDSSAAYIGHLSAHDHEQEVLLHKNARFEVHPVPDEHDQRFAPHDPDHRVLTWHAKLVHDGVKDVG